MAMMTIKRVGILSFAKIQALVMAFFGLIIGVIYGLIFMVFGAALMSGGRDTASLGGGGIAVGLVIMIVMPIFYGVLGFVFGALGGVIYNVAAGFMGGLEIELESTVPDYGTPPPPTQNWAQPPYPPPGQQQPY